MPNENGTWIMRGVAESDPSCIHNVEQLIEYVEKVGFLPLFQNEVPGFSVEERTVPEHWWCEDPAKDPWVWRETIARSGRVAYGKFFHKKAGFISLEWLPRFVNARRDGYDFDARWDDEKASRRQKKIMDLFEDGAALYSFEMKDRAGFGKDGEPNFEGTLTELQMQLYLCVQDFRQRKNKAGQAYGWPIAVYATPEQMWGAEWVTRAYTEEPAESARQIFMWAREQYPEASEKSLRKVLGMK